MAVPRVGRVLTWRDVKVRYKQTVLGVAWAVLQPAMMMVVFTIFLGRWPQVDSGDFPYPLFVYAGPAALDVLRHGHRQCRKQRRGLGADVSKIYFPRLLIPLAAVAAARGGLPGRLFAA